MRTSGWALAMAFAGAITLPGLGNAQAFDPTLQWSWTSSSGDFADWLNVMSVPSVMDLTGDLVPEVIFGATASTGGGLVEVGVLRALNGANGAELFTVTDPNLRISSTASVATGDIDLDGLPEIIAASAAGNQLYAFENDGTFKWSSPVLEAINWGGAAIANIDETGAPEIIVGRQVLNADGTLRWTGTGGAASNAAGVLSLVSDVDLDGEPEIVAGNTIYTAAGLIQSNNPAIGDGLNAAANFDADDFSEIVWVNDGVVRLLDTDLSVLWSTAIPGGGAGGPPTIADFDSDGEAEIGVAGASRYVVFETDGSIKWQAVTQDATSNRTGSSVFDFDGDGAAEVIYGDELFLRVFRGSDGFVLWEEAKSSCTWHEYPLVADVTGDNTADILGVANDNCGLGPQRGVFVWSDDDWVDTRRVWNQHTYHITNIEVDGGVPVDETPNWLATDPTLNNFRLNEYGPGEGPIPEPATLALFGFGVLVAVRAGRRSRR